MIASLTTIISIKLRARYQPNLHTVPTALREIVLVHKLVGSILVFYRRESSYKFRNDERVLRQYEVACWAIPGSTAKWKELPFWAQVAL